MNNQTRIIQSAGQEQTGIKLQLEAFQLKTYIRKPSSGKQIFLSET